MTGPWDHDGHDHDPSDDGVSGLPEEHGSWTADWSSHEAAELPSEPADLPEDPADLPGEPDSPAGLPVEAAHPDAEWPGDPEPQDAPEHADWSGIVDPDPGDPDSTDPTDPTDPAGWGAPGEDAFPPALSLDVEPADGGPWADPDLLGSDPGDAAEPATDPPLALLSDLTYADGGDSADWASVESSDDPAIRSLAAYWRTAV